MPTPDSIEVLSIRVSNAENKIESVEDKIERAFRELQTTISALSFVRNDVYQSDQRSFYKEIENTNKKVDSSFKIAIWSLGTVASLVIAAALGIVLKVSA